jgi:pimeloyl-ACP methyl ester carboxylesterase
MGKTYFLPAQLSDPDSCFININGLNVHYKTAGAGQPVVVLLHGFGSSLFTWRGVFPLLAEHYSVISFDRPAFGLTDRPLQWPGPNPYSMDFQVDLLIKLLDTFDIHTAVLSGNSAGGSLAVNAALRCPKRISALILADAAVYTGGGSPAWIRPFIRSVLGNFLGPLVVRSVFKHVEARMITMSWHNPARVTPEIRSGNEKIFQIKDWDRALWEMTVASTTPDLASRLHAIQQPVLVITGDDDRIVPTWQSIRLAQELPNAELAVIPNCGHLPQEECHYEFFTAVKSFINKENLAQAV